MKKILIILFGNLRHDARVLRQVQFLKGYTLTIASFDAPVLENASSLKLQQIRPRWTQKLLGGVALLLRLYDLAYQIIYDDSHFRKQLTHHDFDLVICNDIETLPIAWRLKGNARLLFDAHEFAPRHFEDKLIWRIFFQGFNKHLCRKYLNRVDAMTTVCQSLSDAYHENYQVTPTVLTNATYYRSLEPTAINPNHIRLVHHGAANPSRQIELTIRMMDLLPNNYSLDLILITPSIANRKTQRYLNSLKKLVASNPRVRILPPLKTDEIVDAIHQYDIGVFLLPPVNFNYANTLPNKFFDFVQARLAIAIGPNKEMAHLVSAHGLGVVAPDFTPRAMAQAILQLTPAQIESYKLASHNAANTLSAEKNSQILNDVVSRLLSA